MTVIQLCKFSSALLSSIHPANSPKLSKSSYIIVVIIIVVTIIIIIVNIIIIIIIIVINITIISFQGPFYGNITESLS